MDHPEETRYWPLYSCRQEARNPAGEVVVRLKTLLRHNHPDLRGGTCLPEPRPKAAPWQADASLILLSNLNERRRSPDRSSTALYASFFAWLLIPTMQLRSALLSDRSGSAGAPRYCRRGPGRCAP